MGRFCIHKLLPFWMNWFLRSLPETTRSINFEPPGETVTSFVPAENRPGQVNGLRLNRFDLRERFPQAGSQSRAAQSNGAVPQECGRIHADSTLYWVAGGNIIARLKRFSFLSFLVSLS
jgi:hypothetical protein